MDSGWKTRIIFLRAYRNHFSGLKILKFFDADPGSSIWVDENWNLGSEIQDGKNLDPGSVIEDGIARRSLK